MRVRDIGTPTELARESGVAQSVVSRFFSGVHSSISLDALEKFAAALEIEPSQLLSRQTTEYLDTRVVQVLNAMEAMPDWGKEAVAASAEAMMKTVQTGKKPGRPQ